MTPAGWQKIKHLLHAALEMGETERAAFLRSISDDELADEADARAELESLLRAHDANPQFLESPYFGEAPDADSAGESVSWTGRVLGSYRLVELVGEGGMGAVFRAVRADGLHDRPVALKLIRSGLSKEFFLRRFQEERRILATLDHPNIARLLDGGASEEGMPYVVMEFVAGLPIDRYCAKRRLSIPDRLSLFREVCSAVQYAHQSLIVHRDLKPANILVTQEGHPKLLDFGIAKIRDPRLAAHAEPQFTMLPMMTPDFASPEQVRGTNITTASDIYSLGVILYVLLTGVRPYRTAHVAPHELMKAICEEMPDRPSTTIDLQKLLSTSDVAQSNGADYEQTSARERKKWSRALRGDLDSIVLKALRKDAGERYTTVEEFSQDLRRHLTGLPVVARRGTTSYYLHKFLARNAPAVLGAAAIAAVLVAALALSVREARVARLQQARAERRFDDVRKLANSLIFELHDSIATLPGAAASRHLIVTTALQYLDSLAMESHEDPALRMELAAAYQRLGEVQGAFTYSEDNYAGALHSYTRALALLQANLKAKPDDLRVRRALTASERRLGDLSWLIGDGDAVLRFSQQVQADYRAIASAQPTDSQARLLWISSDADYAVKVALIRGDIVAGEEGLQSAVARLQSEWRANPKNTAAGRTLALCNYRLAEFQTFEHQNAAAVASADESRRVMESVLALAPQNADFQIQKAAAEHDEAAGLIGLGRLQEAGRLENDALAIVRALESTDPKTAEYGGFVSMGLTRLADIAEREGHVESAIELLGQALQMSDSALSAGTRHPQIREGNAQANALLGAAYAMRASDTHRSTTQRREDWQRACFAYRRAVDSFRIIGPIWFEAIREGQEASTELERCEQQVQLASAPSNR